MARKKSKFITSAVAIMLVISTILAGCGSAAKTASDGASVAPANAANATDAPVKDAPAGKVTNLTFWHPFGSDNEKAAMDESIKMFNDSHKDIHVTAEFIGGSGAGNGITDKLTVAINGGNPPDLVAFDRFQVQQWAG